MRARSTAWAVALVCAPALALSGPALAAAPGPEVLADGLAGPLALAVADDGTVYVAESFGGRLVAVSDRGRVTTVVEAPVGGVDVRGRGTLSVTLSAPPETGGSGETSVARVDPRGRLHELASLMDHEEAENPDVGQTYGFLDASPACAGEAGPLGLGARPGVVESNPYAVLLDGGARLVADAAANAVVRVDARGRTRTLAVLPPVPVEFTEELRQALLAGLPPEDQLPPDTLAGCVGETFAAEPVPTDVERGPDGMLYVSSLPGFPEAPGTGGVFRVDPRTGASTRVLDGFDGAVDLAVAADGTVYVAELFGGRLTRVAPDGSRSSLELDGPGAVEVARDGTVYVTTGVFGDGRLLRLGSWAA